MSQKEVSFIPKGNLPETMANKGGDHPNLPTAPRQQAADPSTPTPDQIEFVEGLESKRTRQAALRGMQKLAEDLAVGSNEIHPTNQGEEENM